MTGQRFEHLRERFEQYTLALLPHLEERHWQAEGSSDDTEAARQRFLRFPMTDDRTVWEDSHAAVTRWRRDPDLATPWWVDEASSDGDRFCVWQGRGPDDHRAASAEQLLIAALCFRVHPLAVNRSAVSGASPGTGTHTDNPVRERMRLLGLAEPAWAGPLGPLMITDPEGFDDISSPAELVSVQRTLMRELAQMITGLGHTVPPDLEQRLTPRWTIDATQWVDNGGPFGVLVNAFDPHGWQFSAAWKERGEVFGHGLSAGQLLYEMVAPAAELERELGIEPNVLVSAIDPAWVDELPSPITRRSLWLRTL